MEDTMTALGDLVQRQKGDRTFAEFAQGSSLSPQRWMQLAVTPIIRPPRFATIAEMVERLGVVWQEVAEAIADDLGWPAGEPESVILTAINWGAPSPGPGHDHAWAAAILSEWFDVPQDEASRLMRAAATMPARTGPVTLAEVRRLAGPTPQPGAEPDMSTRVQALVGYLRARVDEDETRAQVEFEARRDIIDALASDLALNPFDTSALGIISYLAQPFRGRVDFDLYWSHRLEDIAAYRGESRG
jgi:hypothetical protein